MLARIGRASLAFYDSVTNHDILARFDELCQTQWLSPEEQYALRMQRLQALVTYAYTYVPYYRRLFDKVGFRPDRLAEDPDSFQSIPPLSKATMRESLEEFKTTEVARRKGMRQNGTSGSTGEPFVFWEDRFFQSYANANTLRHHTWSGWRPGQLRAYYWGRALHHRLHEKARSLAWNIVYSDAFNPTPETMRRFADFIRRRKPALLHGYTSSLYLFAEFVRQQGWDDVHVPAVYTTSEVLTPYQRECIEAALGCQVFNRYAAEEVAGIACECEKHDGLHISTETNYVEVLAEDGTPVTDGRLGTLVVTNLVNYVFPFIRYRLGDCVRYSHRQCACGRGQPLLETVEGRHHDLFVSRAGYRTALWGLDRQFKEMGDVRKFQVVQKSLDHIVVRLVKDGPLTQSRRHAIEHVIRRALGDYIQIDYEFHADIPVERSGKYRYMVCEVDQNARG